MNYILIFFYRGNVSHATKTGTIAFSPDSALTRQITKDAMAAVALDNMNGLFLLLFDVNMLPEPKGFKNAKEMEKALSQLNAMENVLCGIQFDDVMASMYTFILMS